MAYSPFGGPSGRPRERDLRNFVLATRALNELLTQTDDCITAQYTPKLCRATRPGSGGAPLSRPTLGTTQQPRKRPQSAPSACSRHRVNPKTERWREGGQLRWPPLSSGEAVPDQAESVPYRRAVPNQQQFWGGNLWVGSLRERGVPIADPMYGAHGGNIKELCEEWQQPLPDQYMWPRHDAWSGAPSIPYSGSTVHGKVAIPRQHDGKKWVDRPVAVGRYSLDHMEGKRYEWNAKPRYCMTESKKEEADFAIEAVAVAETLEKEARIAALAAASVF
eukprot:TRINITY_DN1137_c0_g1_i7.p1 TRINITY_DN1137_c0_g1~~TRINITY_DN1137_c0_g1_i7.p1  ORF type:complete len:301 (+),score=34.64 TRINITY_DN1137_c0_g1_i7:74-904(+)